MRERSQDEVQLSGVKAQGLELVLDYIYTSKLSLTLANIQTVLDTATHLQVLQVRKFFLNFHVTPSAENYVQINCKVIKYLINSNFDRIKRNFCKLLIM